MNPQDAGHRGCEKYAELVSAYLDDELNASELLELAAHLKACASCSRLMEEFMEMKDLLRQAEPYWPKPSPTRGFLRAVKRRAREEWAPGDGQTIAGATPAAPRRVATMTVAAMAALLVLAGAAAYFQLRGPSVEVGPLPAAPGAAVYQLAREGNGENLEAYIREHALESSRSLILDYEDNVEFVDHELR